MRMDLRVLVSIENELQTGMLENSFEFFTEARHRDEDIFIDFYTLSGFSVRVVGFFSG